MGLMKTISTSELLNLFGLQIRSEMAKGPMKSKTQSSCEIVSDNSKLYANKKPSTIPIGIRKARISMNNKFPEDGKIANRL